MRNRAPLTPGPPEAFVRQMNEADMDNPRLATVAQLVRRYILVVLAIVVLLTLLGWLGLR